MVRPAFSHALLFAFVSISSALHAQSVSLNVCNAGKLDIDVILSQLGKASSSHIGSADCTTVAETKGSMAPAYIGFAFADSHGQWVAARRLDLLPSLGSDILARANQTTLVRHGNDNVSVAMLLLFKPRVPGCSTSTSESPSAMSQLGLGATPAQVRRARAMDVGRTPGTSSTTCETLDDTLNAEAYADSREITFKQECDPCDKKAEAKLTPAQRAARQRQKDAANQVIGTLSGLGPMGAIFAGAAGRERQEAEEDRKARESRLSPTERMNWTDLLTALRKPGTKIWEKIPRNIIIRGTVSGVEVSKDAFEPIEWVDVAFRESPITDVGPNRRPYSEFNVCASGRDIFTSVFGPDFLTSMIGKTIEVEGETQGAYCRGLRGSIRITLAHQVRPVKSAQIEAGSVPKFVVPPSQPMTPATAAQDAQNKQAFDAQTKYLQDLEKKSQKTAACVKQSEQFAKAHPGDVDAIRKEYYACLQSPDNSSTASAAPVAAPAPGASPAAASDSSAAARAKAEQAQQERIAQQQAAAQQRRAAEVDKAQKTVACSQQLQKAYPDGGRSDPNGFQKAFLACVQAQQAR